MEFYNNYCYFRNGLKLSRDKNVEVRGKKLRLIKVTSDMNGVYSCSGTNPAETRGVESHQNFNLVIPSKYTVRCLLVLLRNRACRSYLFLLSLLIG